MEGQRQSAFWHMSAAMLVLCLTFSCWMVGCNGEASKARNKLEEMNIKYMPDAFVDAINSQNHVIVDLFLQAGMDVNTLDGNGITPLMAAVYSNQTDLIQTLIDKGADINFKGQDELNALMYGVNRGNIPAVIMLVDAGAKVDFEVVKSAVSLNRLDVVQVVLDKYSGDINAADVAGVTLLYLAISRNSGEMAGLLFNRGADANGKTPDGTLLLVYAVERGHAVAATALLENGARPDGKASDGTSLVAYAIQHRQPKVARVLLEKGADIGPGHILMQAIQQGYASIAKVLVEKGADFNVKDEHGKPLLIWAIEKKDAALVDLLLEKGADVNTFVILKDWRCEYKLTALFAAIQAGQPEIVKSLFDRGANFNVKDEHGKPLLIWAIEKKDAALVDLLLKKGADANTFVMLKEWGREYKLTALFAAIKAGQSEIVKSLLGRGADIYVEAGKNQWTLLEYAVSNNQVDIARLLFEKGAPIDKQKAVIWSVDKKMTEMTDLLLAHGAPVNAYVNEYWHYTLLMKSAEDGTIEIAKSLLKRGADINAKDNNGATALGFASEAGHKDIVRLLLDNKAELGGYTRYGRSILSVAAEKNNLEILRMLIDKDADVNMLDKEGQTALMKATQIDTMKLLLENGANANIKQNNGKSAYTEALRQKRTAFIELLNDYVDKDERLWAATEAGMLSEVKGAIAKGANVDWSDNRSGSTPLISAAYRGDTEVVKCLLENGASVNIKNKEGRTALDYAKRRQHASVVKLFEVPPPGSMCMSKQKEAKINLGNITKLQALYMAEHNLYSDNLKDIVFENTSRYYDFYISSAGKDAFMAVAESKEPGISGKGAGDDVWMMDQSRNLVDQINGCTGRKRPGNEWKGHKPEESGADDKVQVNKKTIEPAQSPKTEPAAVAKKPDEKSGLSVVPVPGVDLKSVFRRLEIAGFDPGPFQEHDLSGLSEAVRRFQKLAKIEETGILDEPTWAKMKRLYDPGASRSQ